MLDKKFIREHPDAVRAAAQAKGLTLDVDELLRLDSQVRDLQKNIDATQAKKNLLSKEFARADQAQRESLRAQSTALDTDLQVLRSNLVKAGEDLESLMLWTPTIPWEGAPLGSDESANVVIKVWGEAPRFDFTPLDHTELAERRGWAEFARARKVAGERAYALKGDLVLLERAIHSHALDLLITQGFEPISVPVLVKEAPLIGSGMFPKGRDETYALPRSEEHTHV